MVSVPKKIGQRINSHFGHEAFQHGRRGLGYVDAAELNQLDVFPLRAELFAGVDIDCHFSAAEFAQPPGHEFHCLVHRMHHIQAVGKFKSFLLGGFATGKEKRKEEKQRQALGEKLSLNCHSNDLNF